MGPDSPGEAGVRSEANPVSHGAEEDRRVARSGTRYVAADRMDYYLQSVLQVQ